ncbi:transglycosylase SLT domain-containing protein [Saccharomonospora piscinae]|uniref:transglycosylase SLT domain-containing protein n=1 Tax=Saccharomonospora piscinae TaxID=687388 RepID=UPI00046636FD|nr:transglycosylase SLT domain-containing protein [Saccharomonospora piscinae]
MADHTMLERVKKIIAQQAPTRNLPTHVSSLGRSVRDGARSYASIGVLALFVAGVASPAVMAGTDDEAARTVSAQPAAVAEQQNGSGDFAQDNGSDKPAGGGAPAPRSDDPDAHEDPAGQGGDSGQAEAQSDKQPDEQPAPPPAEPAAHEAGGGGAQPAAPAEPVDQLDGWIRSAIGVMQDHGVPVSEADIGSIRTVIEKESSGDPQAINLWDINAQRGTPSKGLMQTIDSTFNAHKLPGYEDVYDPVSNIIAGTRYTLSRYGSFAEHPGLAQMAGGGGYRGY